MMFWYDCYVWLVEVVLAFAERLLVDTALLASGSLWTAQQLVLEKA